jgi:hypothetical protein
LGICQSEVLFYENFFADLTPCAKFDTIRSYPHRKGDIMYDQTEVTAILHEHARRYPHMQPTDAVKLLYQSEFGGGHLITNPAHSLARLQNEMQATAPNADLPLLEPIGNGLVRLSLAAANANKIARGFALRALSIKN